MAVYKHSYRGYEGTLTPAWSRFRILPRYAHRTLYRTRFLIVFRLLCFFIPLIFGTLIYLAHNLDFLTSFQPAARQFVAINARFFYVYLYIQGILAVLLTAFAGPSLISPDLVNNGLVLYLCRPFSRAEYVLGKTWTLAAMLSSITWIPGLILFGIQASLAGGGWFGANLGIAGAMFAGGVAWVLILALLAMVISAWVRWRIAAGALLLGIFFLGAGFGGAINAVMDTHNGDLINLGSMIAVVWRHLFGLDEANAPISPGTAWAALLIVCALCLFFLTRKVKAYEVVRG